ncbi:MAG: response regulator, partial [Nitrospinae bacterium]|nr:response regulator [Nitrospinota bacterium]
MPKKILIIDDEEAVRQTIENALKKANYEFFFAENGQEGMREFFRVTPDLIILDIRMPVMDGLAFLEEIKITPEDFFSVIVLTGHGDREDMKKCFDLGVTSFVNKPFDIIELRGLVKNAFALKDSLHSLSLEIAKQAKTKKQLKKEIALKEMHEWEKKQLYR